MKLRKNAFTLLEILVVMAILAILLFMMVRVISAFRRNVEVQQASEQIVAGINQTKNFSVNNILPDDVTLRTDSIYAYKLTPSAENDNIVRTICGQSVISSSWECSPSASISDSEQYLVSDYVDNIVLTTEGCQSMLLVNLVSDWKIEDENIDGNFRDDIACSIKLSHKNDDRVYRTFVFDGKLNTFEFKYANH